MNKDAFDKKAAFEFSKFIRKAVLNENNKEDIYCELIKQLMLNSYCTN